ncbi:MAG: hypothetical protein ACYTFG_01385 [Planctomycetota bacterium]
MSLRIPRTVSDRAPVLALVGLAALILGGGRAWAGEPSPRKKTKAVFWQGSLSGEFIGDTKGAAVANHFLKGVRIGFNIRIHGRVTPSGRFEGSYDGLFEPVVMARDFKNDHKEIRTYKCKPEDMIEARGRVTGRGPYVLDEDQKAFMKRLVKALSIALEKWKTKRLLKDGTGRIYGVDGHLPPGSLDCDISAETLKEILAATDSQAYGEDKETYDAACEALAREVRDCIEATSGDLDYPQAAAWNGPAMPPTPNTPMPLGSLSSGQPVTAEGLVEAFEEHGVESEGAETFEALAEVVESAWTAFTYGTHITQVMGSGSVPGYDPSKKPFGAVVNGKMSGGRLTGKPLGEGLLEGLLDRKARSLSLRFHSMPKTIEVNARAVSLPPGEERLVKAMGKQSMGNGYFHPGSEMHIRSFEGLVVKRNGLAVCEVRFDDEKERPSPFGDGVLRQVARTKLSMTAGNVGAGLPETVREKLGLGVDGNPRRDSEGRFLSPSGEAYDHFALMKNLALCAGDATFDPEFAEEMEGFEEQTGTIWLYRSRRTPVRDTGLYVLVEASDSTVLRITSGGSAFSGLDKGKMVLGLPRTFGKVSGGRQKFYLTTASAYGIEVKPGPSGGALRVVVPSSPWTRLEYAVQIPAGGKTLRIQLARFGALTLPEGLDVVCTEDWDGRYAGRAVNLLPAPTPEKNAPKKIPTPADKGYPPELTWPEGVDGKHLGDTETFETVNGLEKLVSRTFSLIRPGQYDKAAIVAHYRAIFEEHGWKGKFDENPRSSMGVFTKGSYRLEIMLARMGPKTTLFRFNLEIDLRGEIEPPSPESTPPRPEPEVKKPAPAEKALSPEKYCEMMGKLILTLGPMVRDMRKEMEGKDDRGKMMVGLKYSKRIEAATGTIRKDYGVTKEWTERAGRQEKYKKAWEAYMDSHPKVKQAYNELQKG